MGEEKKEEPKKEETKDAQKPAKEEAAPKESSVVALKNNVLKNINKIILAGLVGMCIVTISLGYLVLHRPVKPDLPEEEKKVVEHIDENKVGPMYSLEPFVVNLIDMNGRRYLKTSIDFEVEDEKVVKDLDARLPFVRNVIINILSAKTYKDISTVDGKNSLREEIAFRVNSGLSAGKIKNVYFKEFVVQ